MTHLEQLAAAARPTNDDDYGTERQINAENNFFAYLDEYLGDKLTEAEHEEFTDYCTKATTDERITEGLRLASLVAA